MNHVNYKDPLRGPGGSRGKGGGNRNTVNRILPKYQFDTEIREPLVDFVPTELSVPRSRTKLRSSSTSSCFPSSTNTTVGTTPGTSTTERKDDLTILAITTGRGDMRNEVGIAAINLKYPHLILCQINDTQTYKQTLTKLYQMDPIEILIPDTMCRSRKTGEHKLYRLVVEKFPTVNITPVLRCHFNDSEGYERIQNYCCKSFTSVEFVIKKKYYSLAATGALFKYIEFIQYIVYEPKSMKIEFHGCPDTALIDMESVEYSELVSSLCNIPRATLLNTLNKCCTLGGKKQLRASILQPPCKESVIQKRLCCVDELMKNPSLSLMIQPVLRRLSRVDRLLALSWTNTQLTTIQSAERNLNYILLLKTSLDIIPELRATISTCESDIFIRISHNLSDSRFELMKEKILELIHQEARSVHGFTSSNMQRCFAIRVGKCQLLDISRQSYCELIDEMKNMIKNLAEKHNLPLSLACDSIMGFHIQVRLPRPLNMKIENFPKEFIEVRKVRNVFYMTTSKLLFMSQQCKLSCEELHAMSNVLLLNLLADLRVYVDCLFQLCDNVAELDLIMSLSETSRHPGYVKPSFGTKLNVQNSRNPVFESLGKDSVVANNVFADLAHNFHTITGPNMSGKTFYLKQIVYLQIMAQIGCYVPATSAEFRLCDRIFCKLHSHDEIENNASTFAVEIKGIEFILQSITPKSLVILDELCKGTNVEEGSSIAWAICEHLLVREGFTFSATHFMKLAKLQELYPNVTNHYFDTQLQEIRSDPNTSRLIYTHQLKRGVQTNYLYGITLAEFTGTPKDIIAQAKIYADEETTNFPCPDYIPQPALSYEAKCRQRIVQMYELSKQGKFTEDNIIDLIKIDLNGIDLSEEFENAKSKKIRKDNQVPIFDDQVQSTLEKSDDDSDFHLNMSQFSFDLNNEMNNSEGSEFSLKLNSYKDVPSTSSTFELDLDYHLAKTPSQSSFFRTSNESRETFKVPKNWNQLSDLASTVTLTPRKTKRLFSEVPVVSKKSATSTSNVFESTLNDDDDILASLFNLSPN